jgi:hypothetical protein
MEFRKSKAAKEVRVFPSKWLFAVALSAFMPVCVAAAQVSGKPGSYPSFVRLSLAGSRLEDEGSYVKYDQKERYYLIATGDCDGASIDLILSPDPKGFGFDSSDAASRRRVKRVTLPRLRTGTGVNIGDTPQQVRRKLGVPPHWSSYDRETKEREWVYRAAILVKSRQQRGKQYYRATYTFHNERLWSIHYNMQEEDGCG